MKALLRPKIIAYVSAYKYDDEKVMDIRERVVVKSDKLIIIWVCKTSSIFPIMGINKIIVIMVGTNNPAAIFEVILKCSLKIVTWKKWRAVTRLAIEKNENERI